MAEADLTVVVMAHDRPRSLDRLLRSLGRAECPAGTPLVISVDPGGPGLDGVLSVARRFDAWSGPVEIQVAEEPLGLVAHFTGVGSLTSEVGPVVILEDDLVVGPGFARWAVAALDAYGDSPRVGGISLNSLWFHGIRHLPFQPLLDGSDAFAVSVAWYHGMVVHPQWWSEYRQWADGESRAGATGHSGHSGPSARTGPPNGARSLPAVFSEFAPDEWFPTMTRWLVESGRTFIFPRWSHATNNGDPGTHFDRPTDWFQTPLVESCSEPRLPPDGGWVGYDAWQEIELESLFRRSPWLADRTAGDLTVDLWALRDRSEVTTEWILTTRRSSNPEFSWGAALRPLEANVIGGSEGDSIHLGRVDDIDWSSRGLREALRLLARHSAHGRRPSLREVLGSRISEGADALRSVAGKPRRERSR